MTRQIPVLLAAALTSLASLTQGQEVAVEKDTPVSIKVTGEVPRSETHVVFVKPTADSKDRQPGLLLGVTAIVNGEEKDFPAKVVRGRFKESYSISLYRFAEGGASVTWKVSLWRGKATSAACAQQNGGTACEYCRKNGYHMVDRVASAESD